MSKLKVRVNGSWEWLETGQIPLASVPGVILQAPDGGKNFYGNKGYTVSAVLDNPNYFPIAVWYESVLTQTDIDQDKDTGLNTYVVLTADSDLSLIRTNGMYAVQSGVSGYGSETVGWFLDDEVDMRFAIGWGANQGYTVMQNDSDALPQGDGRMRQTNYGKGIVLRTLADVTAAQVFINQFQQTVSDDFYWYTDGDIWNQSGAAPWNQGAQFYDMMTRDLTKDEAQRGCHYGNVVRVMRDRCIPYRWQPVWGFVENGGPFDTNTQLSDYMVPEVMVSAVWHMIIAGARGIIYFNHTFGGPNQSQHNFRMAEYATIQQAAKQVNGRITSLAPVINDDFALNFVSVTPVPTIFSGIETMAKYHAGTFYIFAGSRDSTTASPVTATFTIPTGVGGTATVLFESRTIAITNGQFSDTFANGTAVHIYRIDP